jgi:lactate permease
MDFALVLQARILLLLLVLLASGTRPAWVWRLLLPSMAVVLGLGPATVALLR